MKVGKRDVCFYLGFLTCLETKFISVSSTKAGLRCQSKEISSIKKVNIVKLESCEENQTQILQADTVSKRVRGSENHEEIMSEEIWGWLKLSWTFLCLNYHLYDILYYHKHFGITDETKLVHFSVHPLRKNLRNWHSERRLSSKGKQPRCFRTRFLWSW